MSTESFNVTKFRVVVLQNKVRLVVSYGAATFGKVKMERGNLAYYTFIVTKKGVKSVA